MTVKTTGIKVFLYEVIPKMLSSQKRKKKKKDLVKLQEVKVWILHKVTVIRREFTKETGLTQA